MLLLAGPLDDGLVEELGAVVEVQTGYLDKGFPARRPAERPGCGCARCCARAGEDPPGVHVGQVQGAGELALEGRAAVRDGVALEEPRLGLDLIACLADLDRRPQQRRGFRGRDTPDLVAWPSPAAGSGRSTPPLIASSSGPHRRAVAVTADDQLAVPFQAVQLHAHRRREVLAALPTRGGPHPSAAPSTRHRSTSAPAACVAASRPCGPPPAAASPPRSSRRRALSRDQPVTDTTWSRIRPLSVLRRPSHTPWRTSW